METQKTGSKADNLRSGRVVLLAMGKSRNDFTKNDHQTGKVNRKGGILKGKDC